MSKFSEEMLKEAEIRLYQYTVEKERLLTANDRIAELNALITEAEEEIGLLKAKVPKKDAAS